MSALPSPASAEAAKGGPATSKWITYLVKARAKSAKGKLARTTPLISFDTCKAKTGVMWQGKAKLGAKKKVLVPFVITPARVQKVTVEFKQGKGKWRKVSTVTTAAHGTGRAKIVKKKPAAQWRHNVPAGARTNSGFGRGIKAK